MRPANVGLLMQKYMRKHTMQVIHNASHASVLEAEEQEVRPHTHGCVAVSVVKACLDSDWLRLCYFVVRCQSKAQQPSSRPHRHADVECKVSRRANRCSVTQSYICDHTRHTPTTPAPSSQISLGFVKMTHRSQSPSRFPSVFAGTSRRNQPNLFCG
jgi:hypothetical protein